MKPPYWIIPCLLLWACSTPVETPPEASPNHVEEQFESLRTQFIDSLWHWYPEWAVYEGNHAYDTLLPVPNETLRQGQLQFSAEFLERIEAFPQGQLTMHQRTDLDLMRNFLQSVEWKINTYRDYEWNPAVFNVGGGFSQVLNNRHIPLEIRLTRIYHRLANVPAYYAAAKQNLNTPTVVHTDLAIVQNQGALSVFQEIRDSAHQMPWDTARILAFDVRLDTCVEAITSHLKWLQELKVELELTGGKDFRIGQALYARKFEFDIQSEFSAAEVYA